MDSDVSGAPLVLPIAAVAAGDFDQFWALNSGGPTLVGDELVPTPIDGLADSVSPYNKLRARDEFERVVRSNRIRASILELLEPVVVATEYDRCTIEVFDARGIGVGVQMQIRELGDGYRMVGLHPIPPGKLREAVADR